MYQRILVPIDGSATARRGLNEAMSLARLTGAQLRLIHVVDELSFAVGAESFGAYSGDLIAALREAGQLTLNEACAVVKVAGLPVEGVLRESFQGRVSELVLDEAAQWPADLIVIGTHGRRGAKRLFMGSDAEQILRSAPVPVLLVRASDEQA